VLRLALLLLNDNDPPPPDAAADSPSCCCCKLRPATGLELQVTSSFELPWPAFRQPKFSCMLEALV
jgi:hypothetical protein